MRKQLNTTPTLTEDEMTVALASLAVDPELDPEDALRCAFLSMGGFTSEDIDGLLQTIEPTFARYGAIQVLLRIREACLDREKGHPALAG